MQKSTSILAGLRAQNSKRQPYVYTARRKGNTACGQAQARRDVTPWLLAHAGADEVASRALSRIISAGRMTSQGQNKI